MRRFASILLLFCFLALGTGTLERLHSLQHAADDARADAIAAARGEPAPDHHHHDDSNCAVHAQLHMALFTANWAPLLVCLGLLIAYLRLAAERLAPANQPARLCCRGPPAR